MLIWQYGTVNIKELSCLLSADGARALFYFLFLANFVDGASAYFFTFISIFFSNKWANPKTKESIWCSPTVIFFNFLDVLNLIICMFSSIVDEI